MTNCNNCHSFPTKNTNLKDLKILSQNFAQFETRDETINWWCDGCGNFAILNALKRAFALKKLAKNDIICCYDVGCNGNESDKIELNTIHGLHGRVLPLAAGIKIANQDKVVIASAGDGATFSEGVNHLVHTIRNNYPIIFLHHDNKNYALTTGQATALTPKGYTRNSSPFGVAQDSINSLQFVLSLNPSFVARTMSADINHMTDIFLQALNHKGFVFIDIMQTCPTYCRETTNDWYLKNTQDTKDLENYNVNDIWVARKLVENDQKDATTKTPIGIIYKNEQKETFLDSLYHRKNIKTNLTQEVKHYDISELLKDL
jgi:2-oxoglutarate ferredoxin oxidoreductase subunit beta